MPENQSPPPQFPPPGGAPRDAPQGMPMWSNQTPTEALAAAYGPPQGPPPRRPRYRKPVVVTAVAVAFALVVGLGAWFLGSGDDDKSATAGAAPSGGPGRSPKGPGGRSAQPVPPVVPVPPKGDPTAGPTADMAYLWGLPQVADDHATADEAPRGGWLTAARVYVVRRSGIAVYDTDTGVPLGAIALPSGDRQAVVCSALARPLGGVGLVAWEPGKDSDEGCVHVTAVDLATGAVLWTQKLDEGGGLVALTATDRFAVAGVESTVYGFDLRSGTRLWRWATPADTAAGGRWFVRDVLAAERSVAVTLSNIDMGETVGGIATIDAASGATTAQSAPAEGIQDVPRLVSASPVVVYDYDAQKPEQAALVVYDHALNARTRLAPVSRDDTGIDLEDSMMSPTGPNAFEGSAAVSGGTLYATLWLGDSGRAVAAYDLADGKTLWAVSTKTLGGPADPITADAQGVDFAFGNFVGDEKRIVHFAAADGAISTTGILRGGQNGPFDVGGLTVVAGGRAAFFSPGQKHPVVEVFGAR
ncbi:MAG: PQQ-binding-like beta-propeller repeat protein [Streptomycetaceae bacterium]|nr:PQQ-binding-like beta-propeller repeat protein [Streptomycetaceae bacterium]